MNTLKCHKTHVIACDLDDSLVATRSHSEQSRRASDDALLKIGALVAALRTQGDENIFFGSATGRTLGSMQDLAAERSAFGEIFQTMDFHIASVGAAIHTDAGSNFERIAGWPHTESWNRAALMDQLSLYPELTLQEPAAQDEYKISYTTRSALDSVEHAGEIVSYLNMAGLHADLVVSGGGDHRFVDVLPVGVNKGSAMLQLPQLLRKSKDNDDRYSEVCRIAAGDSMNDQGILAIADVSIIPGNGQPDLLEWATTSHQINTLYITDEYFAAGVLQGLQQHLYGL